MNLNSPDHDPGLDDQKINIYFVGWIQFIDPGPPLEETNYNGNAVDPKDRENTVVAPHIFISDRGFPTSKGGLGQAGVVLADHVLEHEFCHYLLRAKAAVGQSGRYDQSEHDSNPGAIHLMKPKTAHGDISQQDVAECENRVINNNYLVP